MKKLVLVLALSVILAVGAFAEHPGGWGIGIMGQRHFKWAGFAGNWGGSLSLKVPQKPVFWGLSLHTEPETNYFGLSATGDYYLIDKKLKPDINFGYYFGIGSYAGFYHFGGDKNLYGIGAGARVPIGIYFFPVSFFEVFVDVAPSLGLEINIGNGSGPNFPAGGLGADLGVRFWF